MRPSVALHNAPGPAPIDSLAGDIQYYLTLTPRQLPSRYFYDALGSALFEAICALPWYAITRAERALLEHHGAAILARVDPLATLIELGPGSGDKLAALVASGGARDRRLAVHLVDVSRAALEQAGRTLSALDVDLAVFAHQATYESGLIETHAQLSRACPEPGRGGRTLVLFLGSNIGNFDPPGADEFLRTIRSSLSGGDMLLIGADLVKPERDLLLAYDDPLGVTAAFNRNLLVRINRELGADFDVDAFAHRAVWNAGESRVEMHLVAARSQHVRIPGASLEVTFEEGESIWTESSYKYQPDQIVEILARAGFTCVEQWKADREGFALTLVAAA
jgi:dimethylhistidine N-methyltransferase